MLGTVDDEAQASRDGLSEQERRRTIELANSYRQLRSCCARGKETRRHDKGNDVRLLHPQKSTKFVVHTIMRVLVETTSSLFFAELKEGRELP